MRFVVALASLAIAGSAQAQCLVVGDPSGTATVSCPDGRSGVLHTEGGATTGLIGGQAYTAPSAAITPDASLGYLQAPPVSAPLPSYAPAQAEPLPPPSAAPELSDLQRQYLAEQAARRAKLKP